MKRALVDFIAKVEGVVRKTISGASSQAPSCFAPPIKILAAPLQSMNLDNESSDH